MTLFQKSAPSDGPVRPGMTAPEMALALVGSALSILQMRPLCIWSLVPQVLLLSTPALPGPLDFHPPFCIKCCYTPLLRSLWDLSSPAPALSVCSWGRSYCESSVHIYRDFLGPNHVFHHLHFLYFNKNEMKMEMPIWLFRKSRTMWEVW